MSSPSNNQCLCKEDGFGISRTLCPVHGPVASNNLKEQVEEIITKHRLILSEAIPVDKATTQILNLILDTILANIDDIKLEHDYELENARATLVVRNALEASWAQIKPLLKAMLEGMRK